MKYYVIADPHGFYDILMNTLTESGFFTDPAPCKLIVCGDLLDRGEEPDEMQRLMAGLLKQDRLIFIRGNHEDLMERLLTDLETGYGLDRIECGESYHVKNGTWLTALQLSGMSHREGICRPEVLIQRVKHSLYYSMLMPAALNYFETEHYVFTHGYIPCRSTVGDTQYRGYKSFYFNPDWRNASSEDWENARWYNGMEFAYYKELHLPDKTVVCGHFHCSYGHANIEGRGQEFGRFADFAPFYGKRRRDPEGPLAVIALDACTKVSGIMNCIVLEDGDLTAKQG